MTTGRQVDCRCEVCREFPDANLPPGFYGVDPRAPGPDGYCAFCAEHCAPVVTFGGTSQRAALTPASRARLHALLAQYGTTDPERIRLVAAGQFGETLVGVVAPAAVDLLKRMMKGRARR